MNPITGPVSPLRLPMLTRCGLPMMMSVWCKEYLPVSIKNEWTNKIGNMIARGPYSGTGNTTSWDRSRRFDFTSNICCSNIELRTMTSIKKVFVMRLANILIINIQVMIRITLIVSSRCFPAMWPVWPMLLGSTETVDE